MNSIAIRKEINLNTVVSVVGFLTVFAGIVFSYAIMQASQKEAIEKIANHEVRLGALEELAAGKAQFEYRMGQNEKSIELTGDRISRMAESYANQFTDIRAQLNVIVTQQALQTQSLQRLEQAGMATPKELRP